MRHWYINWLKSLRHYWYKFKMPFDLAILFLEVLHMWAHVGKYVCPKIVSSVFCMKAEDWRQCKYALIGYCFYQRIVYPYNGRYQESIKNELDIYRWIWFKSPEGKKQVKNNQQTKIRQLIKLVFKQWMYLHLLSAHLYKDSLWKVI